jgi:hypothetical protein
LPFFEVKILILEKDNLTEKVVCYLIYFSLPGHQSGTMVIKQKVIELSNIDISFVAENFGGVCPWSQRAGKFVCIF